MDIYLEIGQKKIYASALEWPGLAHLPTGHHHRVRHVAVEGVAKQESAVGRGGGIRNAIPDKVGKWVEGVKAAFVQQDDGVVRRLNAQVMQANR